MYQTKCPNCKAPIGFNVKAGVIDRGAAITEKDIDARLSLVLHGQTTKCVACGAKVELERVRVMVPSYEMRLSFVLPLYDGKGQVVGYHPPGENIILWRE